MTSCIKNGIFASEILNVNDPHEGKDIDNPNQYRIVCLTESKNNILMWAYYGNHRGCCVGFDVSGIDGIKKNDYTDECQKHAGMTNDEIVTSLYKKGKDWEKELEYRLVYDASSTSNAVWKKDGDLVFLDAPVKSVIFGLYADQDYKYDETLESLKVYKGEIAITRCKLMEDQYHFEDEPLEIDAELMRLNPKRTVYCKGIPLYGGLYNETK